VPETHIPDDSVATSLPTSAVHSAGRVEPHRRRTGFPVRLLLFHGRSVVTAHFWRGNDRVSWPLSGGNGTIARTPVHPQWL